MGDRRRVTDDESVHARSSNHLGDVMDASRFDLLTRRIGHAATRRQALRALAAGAAFAVGQSQGKPAVARTCGKVGDRCGTPGAFPRCCGDADCVEQSAGISRCACAAEFTNCAGFCVDLQRNVEACGRCGNECPDRAICAGGECVCPGNQIVCDRACRDLNSDAKACGACGVRCKGGQRCCDGACVDVGADGDNCGACGLACAQDEACCGGRCRSLADDPRNCGACGHGCSRKESCCGGACCPSGWACCGERCVLLTSDDANCGKCGVACPAGRTCTNAACLLAPGQQCIVGSQCASGRCINPPSSVGFCDERRGSTCRADQECRTGDPSDPNARCEPVPGSGERRCGGCRPHQAACNRSSQCCASDCSSPGNDPKQPRVCLSEINGRCERDVDCRACQERGDCAAVCVHDPGAGRDGRCAR
jgi:hypothetical protein